MKPKCTWPNAFGNALGQSIAGQLLRPAVPDQTNAPSAAQADYFAQGNGPIGSAYARELDERILGKQLDRYLNSTSSNNGFDLSRFYANDSASPNYGAQPELDLLRGDKGYNTYEGFNTDSNGFNHPDSYVKQTYHFSDTEKLDNILYRAQRISDSTLGAAPAELGYFPTFLNIGTKAVLGAPRILLNGQYLPRQIARGNAALATAKDYVQSTIVDAGGYGVRRGGIIGGTIQYGAAAAYVVDEIFQPKNLVEAGLLFAGPAIGKLGAGALGAAKTLPFLGADVGVLSQNGLRLAASGNDILLSGLGSKLGFPSLYPGVTSGSERAFTGTAIDEASSAAGRIVDELFSVPGGQNSTNSNIVTLSSRAEYRAASANPKPNTIYEYNDHTFETDSLGRGVNSSGDLTLGNGGNRFYDDRLLGYPHNPDALPGDIAFHAGGDQFGFPGGGLNLFPGNSTLNSASGAYGIFERTVLRPLVADTQNTVRGQFSRIFEAGNLTTRPDSLQVIYNVNNGAPITTTFLNR